MRRALLLVLSAIVAACGASNEPTDTKPASSGPPASPDLAAVTSGPLAARLNEEMKKQYAAVEGMTYADLLADHAQTWAEGPSFDVSQVQHYDGFVSTFGLGEEARSKLRSNGFVVVPVAKRQASMDSVYASDGAGPADVFYQVFAANLPVFISADAILHAWHRSFDRLIEAAESQVMIQRLGTLVDATIAALDASDPADRDALFYMTVARALLSPSAPVPSAVQADVQRYLDLIASRQIVEVDFMGSVTTIDFSQFVPRGHYTHSQQLERYFLAMMWLGRTDLVLYSPDEARPREEAAARALARAMAESGAKADFATLDSFYAGVVGKTNALTPSALEALCEEAGLPKCVGDAASMTSLYAKQPPPEYSSRVFAGDVAPIAMRFFPQRFAYCAWVTTQTTTPRLPPAVQGGRAMAMPEDVAFAFGSDRAAAWLDQDMAKPHRENLPATLEAARRTMGAIPPTSLDDTVFNHWIEALQAEAAATVDPSFPEVMRTALWHDRKMESVLASWAELRHDTILVVEQSTGGIGCQYPKGYVEPVPELYEALSHSIGVMAPLFETPELATMSNVGPFLSSFQDVLAKLVMLSNEELAGVPMSDAELTFLNETADLHGNTYYGDRQFNGWYPRLFWSGSWSTDPSQIDGFDAPSGVSEPIVADVHTDAENGLALEVGTGHPGLVIVAVDQGGDRAIYGGPVSSYYSVAVPVDKRLTDNDWLARIDGTSVPERPRFAQGYWAE